VISSRPKKKPPADKPKKVRIGWREWVSLPDLGVDRIKAKVDTGARSSSIHASNIKTFKRNGKLWVSFDIYPLQRNRIRKLACSALITDRRRVTSSSGKNEERYFIETTLKVANNIHVIEISLTNRDQMGFRLLLGRTALRGLYFVDPEKSFLADK